MAERLDATFFAFRKREGGLLLGASIAYSVLLLILMGAVGFAIVSLSGRDPLALLDVFSKAEADPNALEGAFSAGALVGMLLTFLLFVFAACILTAAYEAACLRWMIRGEKKGLFGLALDADTFRVYGIYWVWLIFFVIGAILFVIFMAIVGFILGATFGPESPVLMAMPILFFIIPLYVTVRLAPAAAASVAERRFVFFDGWIVSRERFWALFGAFFLLWLIYTIVTSCLSYGLLVWGIGWERTRALADHLPDMTAYSQAVDAAQLELMTNARTWWAFWAVQIVSFAASILFYVALFGVNARAALAALEDGKIEQEAD